MTIKQMTFDDYQTLARRTQNPALSRDLKELHALHGLAAESGEIHSIYQKVYQGHHFDKNALEGEIGDVLWNLAELCDANKLSLGEIAEKNIEKLKKRYPDGFNEYRSVHRDEFEVYGRIADGRETS